MRAYDPDDTFYAAAVLAVDGTVVSNDQAFEKLLFQSGDFGKEHLHVHVCVTVM